MFRLRKTLLKKKRAFASACFAYAKRYFQKTGRFSSTRNTRFFENCALVYAKHYFFAWSRMRLSRQVPVASWQEAPRRPGPGDRPKFTFFCTPSAAKSHAISGPEFWPGQNGSVNVMARVCIDFPDGFQDLCFLHHMWPPFAHQGHL